jgi:hypothetical protein
MSLARTLATRNEATTRARSNDRQLHTHQNMVFDSVSEVFGDGLVSTP